MNTIHNIGILENINIKVQFFYIIIVNKKIYYNYRDIEIENIETNKKKKNIYWKIKL